MKVIWLVAGSLLVASLGVIFYAMIHDSGPSCEERGGHEVYKYTSAPIIIPGKVPVLIPGSPVYDCEGVPQ